MTGPDEIEIVNLEEGMADELARIESACFPMANPDDLLSADDTRAYARVFPEGCFVALSTTGGWWGWGRGYASTSTSPTPSTPSPGSPVSTSAAITTRKGSGTTGPT